MRAGKLRHLVTIQAATETQNDFGEPITTWSTFATGWASIEPVSGREYFAAKQINSDQVVKIMMRHIDGVTSEMRITHGGIIYDIEDVIDVAALGVEMQIMCRVHT